MFDFKCCKDCGKEEGDLIELHNVRMDETYKEIPRRQYYNKFYLCLNCVINRIVKEKFKKSTFSRLD